MKNEELDLNKDGEIDNTDLKICETKLKIVKDRNQVQLAWVAMISILIVTALLLTPWVDVSKVKALGDVLDLFYVCQASVIGFYVGANTYLRGKETNKNKANKYYRESDY